MSGSRDFEREIAEEDELTSILRASEPAATIPPFADIVRRAERHQSVSPGVMLAAAALVVVVFVAAIGALRSPADPGVSTASEKPTLSPSPAAPSPTPTVSATPAPSSSAPAGAALRPELGVIYDGVRQGYEKGSAPLVRREGETHFAVGELAPSFFNQFMGSVSPDGRRAVYFAQRQGQPWTLYLLDATTNPNDQRVVRTIPDEIPAEPPLWSFDGNGIAFVVMDSGANQGVKPKYTALRTLDLASGTVTEIARVEDGSHYSVVGWDRASSTVAAVLYPYGAAATKYLVFAPSGLKSWTLDGVYSMAASPSGRDVAGVRCDRQGSGACTLWIWSLVDFGSKTDQNLGPNLSVTSLGWRPGTSELGLLVGAVGASADRIELWSASGGRRFLAQVRGADYGRPFFRADASALIVQTSQTEASLVDLASGGVSSFPLHEPEAPLGSNRIRASIRLPQ
jgi:hypothetical protein